MLSTVKGVWRSTEQTVRSLTFICMENRREDGGWFSKIFEFRVWRNNNKRNGLIAKWKKFEVQMILFLIDAISSTAEYTFFFISWNEKIFIPFSIFLILYLLSVRSKSSSTADIWYLYPVRRHMLRSHSITECRRDVERLYLRCVKS